MPEVDKYYVTELEQRVAGLEQRKARCESYLNGPSLPGSFVTGRSGQSAAYGRKLDRQLDKTIGTAVELRKINEDLAHWKRRLERYVAGKVHRNGRTVKVEVPKPKRTLLPIATPDQVRTAYPAAPEVTRERWNKTHKDYRGYAERDGMRIPAMMLPRSEGGYGPVVITEAH